MAEPAVPRDARTRMLGYVESPYSLIRLKNLLRKLDMTSQDDFDPAACRGYLLDRSLGEVDRVAAAESLTWDDSRETEEALFSVVSDETDDDCVREEAMDSLVSIWSERGLPDMKMLVQMPNSMIEYLADGGDMRFMKSLSRSDPDPDWQALLRRTAAVKHFQDHLKQGRAVTRVQNALMCQTAGQRQSASAKVAARQLLSRTPVANVTSRAWHPLSRSRESLHAVPA